MANGRRLNPAPTSSQGSLATLRALPEVFQYTRHALELVWATSRPLTIALALLTLVAGIVPAGIAFVGALIVDAVVAAITWSRCWTPREVNRRLIWPEVSPSADPMRISLMISALFLMPY